jgi:hypothetical protein
MKGDSQLTLEKFGSIGGDYFEHLVAVALDELGYEEGKTYLPSWAKMCVPGTWIEADFIISKKNDKSGDPLNNGRIVLAIGHATSENSAGMKFHRDVEQLLEVKALANGDEYRVMDILFCCPRETMGGWSKELVAINEAIFDNSLIVWKHDWGLRLLQQIQLHGEKLTQGDNGAKKKKLKDLLSKHPAFRKQFESLRSHLSSMLTDTASHSRITDIFEEERKQLPIRLAMPLQITDPEKTDFKRGLLQVLALNPWEVELLHENHAKNKDGKVLPLEKLALDSGMSQKDFDQWWERLKLLSVKLGTCSSDFIGDEILDSDAKEWRMFKASRELGYVLEKFTAQQLNQIRLNLPAFAPNLVPYVKDLNDINRYFIWRSELQDHIVDGIQDFHKFATTTPDNSHDYVRLGYVEVGMTIINISNPTFSYDKLAKATGVSSLVSQSDHARFFAAGQRSTSDSKAKALTATLRQQLRNIANEHWSDSNGAKNFVSRRLDGMIKQHRGGILDVILGSAVKGFANRIGAKILLGTNHVHASPFNEFASTEQSGVNVEVPYVLILKDGGKILIHRVNANDGHSADKRKEFSSKIRSIRYQANNGRFSLRTDLVSTILVIDGKWIPESNDDPLSHIRMLTVAGWDYVVYPDQLNAAFAAIEAKLDKGGKTKPAKITPIQFPEEEDLAMAAENEGAPKLKKAKRK